MQLRIFRYLPEVDAFDVTPEYRSLAEHIGLSEWNPVVWIGRFFILDNDLGEHWFDNWDAREAKRALALQHGYEADFLLIIDPDRFQDGKDGPCHSASMRARFWRDVLMSLELSIDLLFDQAREMNIRTKKLIDDGWIELQEDYIPDLEDRIVRWKHSQGRR